MKEKQNIIKLRKSLPKGWFERVQKETGYTKSKIYRAMSGKFPNQVVVSACIGIAIEERDRIEKFNQLIKEL